ncbi:ABC transporter permease subunit [Sediminispirochaeta bajacaliforniensis]|uniref:ABC transporter permease subunit n=1 Tax=Sediminispirochaeta bajacaliforniensis TaxID=148 RepID=UPI0003777781|nr:branched-chain amino acid ABC transporter permease [Sediminispirochaeta bajacaliforniensis]
MTKINLWKEAKTSLFIALWFVILTFPIMVIKVNTIDDIVEWRWVRILFVGIGAFFFSAAYRYMLYRRKTGARRESKTRVLKIHRLGINTALDAAFFSQKKVALPGILFIAIAIILFPFITSMYQTNIISTALLSVMLGMGLNIVVGLGGMLHLGYIAFYAVGAYTYALLNYHFGVNFWVALPLGGLFSMIFGILLGIPVLRLKGDYLAIVTLGFGEIIRIVLENWNEFSFGPSGIANIPRPGFFGVKLSIQHASIFTYFILVALVVFTIFIVSRLKNSRLGRAWEAMREDDIACEAMGVDITKAKMTAFALGAFWAGLAGVVFASKTTFINPASFTMWESIVVLCIVVLGGMGSLGGVVIGALLIVLLPEYLRAFSEYRMLLFGAVLVVMMIFRPEGLIRARRHVFTFEHGENKSEAEK